MDIYGTRSIIAHLLSEAQILGTYAKRRAQGKGINDQGNILVGPQLQRRSLAVGTVQREGRKG
jgi:hypothetical protein